MPIDINDFYREAGTRISSSLDLDEALSRLFEYLSTIFPLDAINLTYREPDGNLYSVSEAGKMQADIERDAHQPMLIIDPRMMEQFVEYFRAQNMVVDDVLIFNQPVPSMINNLIMQQYPTITQIPSSLILFLNIGDDEVGLFSLVKYGNNIFNREQASLLQQIKHPVAIAMSNARRYRQLKRLKENLVEDNRALQEELVDISGGRVIGGDKGLRNIMEMVQQAAPLNSPVLLLGETGTGKEVIANALHQLSPRRNKPIVRVHCGAIPDTLLDSELFGHEKGSFTGAVSSKRGRFERADGGTIFLDEIGELTQEAQVRLLRVLQEHEIERLGGDRTIKIDVRVIAATHRNLPKMIEEGRFREDLWYRLNVFPIEIPPLRERRQDIPDLTAYFINKKAAEMGLSKVPALAPGSLERLVKYDWPGNVRELQNVVERALITRRNGSISFDELSRGSRTSTSLAAVQENGTFKPLNSALSEHIKQALDACNGRIEGEKGAAALLQMNPSTLRAKIRKLKIT